jgi:general secretion pathway protein B
MSLILDALKKLDREKTAKNGGRMDLTAEILKAGDSPRNHSVLPLVLTLAITASVAAVVTYLTIGGSGPRMGDSRSTVPAVPVQTQRMTAAPLPPVAAAVTDKPPIPPDVSPTAPPAAVSEAMQASKTKNGGKPATTARATAGVETIRKATAPPDEGPVNMPALKVSGIIWEEVSSERKAVINGTVAREGDSVAGVKVLEIYPTYVVVSSKGKSFKVKMFD